MTSVNASPLPVVLAGSVIRIAKRDEPHGALYLVDLETGRFENVLEWSSTKISFLGRGGQRGLRGLAFHGGRTYVATYDTIMVLDESFAFVKEFTNPYLADLHEMCIAEGRLYVASTAFDSVVVFDLESERFVEAYCFRNDVDRRIKKGLWKILGLKIPPGVRPVRFDPNVPDGPRPDDVIHLNNVHVEAGIMFFSTLRCRRLYRFDGTRVEAVVRLPLETHNARPFRDGALMCSTAEDRVLMSNSAGRAVRACPAAAYAAEELENDHLPANDARKFFMRGLAVHQGSVVIAGQSPATVTAYDIDSGEVLRSVVLSYDVRNTIHGLDIFPYARPTS